MISYEAIEATDTNGNLVVCSNLPTARAYQSGRLPTSNPSKSISFTYQCKAFVSPSGQYYIEVDGAKVGETPLRIDVANAKTARHYVRNGVETGLVVDAYTAQVIRLRNLNQ